MPTTLTDKDFENHKLSDSDFSSGASIGPASGATQYLEEAPALQEMPPDVSESDRLKLKNFANSPEAMVGYLQKAYPQYNVKHFENNVYFEDPKKNLRYVLDPNQSLKETLTTGKGAIEGLKDLGDVAYDIPAGLASTAAGTAGAFAAGVPTGGTGALPGAMASAGVTGAGLEALRQKIGKSLGIPQEVNPMDVGISGAANAAAPLFFGPGGTLAKEGIKTGLKEAEAKALEQGSEGIFSRALPWLYSKASGIPEVTIKTAGNNLNKIKDLEKSQTPQNDMAKQVIGDIERLKTAKEAAGKAKEMAVKTSTASVPLAETKQPYLDKIADLESMENRAIEAGDEGALKLASQMKKAVQEDFDNLFGGFGDSTSAEGAQALKQSLKSPANVSQAGSKGIGVADNLDWIAQLKQSLARQAGKANTRAMSSSVEGSKEVDQAYSAIGGLLKKLGPSSKSEDRALNLVKQISSGKKEALAEDLASADKNLGTGFIDKANLIDAFNTFRSSRPVQLGIKQLKQRSGAEAVGAGTGAYLGYKNGGWGGGALGGVTGAGAGFALGSPTAVRGALNLGNLGSKYAAPALRPALMPTWQMLQEYKEQNP